MDDLDKEFNGVANAAGLSSDKCPEGGEHKEQENVWIYPYEGGEVLCYKCKRLMRRIPWTGGY